MTHDYALTDDGNGKVMAHKADCPEARRRADAGEPVITLFQCLGGLPKDIKRHSCLEEPT
jgi:hypothetical protein